MGGWVGGWVDGGRAGSFLYLLVPDAVAGGEVLLDAGPHTEPCSFPSVHVENDLGG